MHLLVRSAGGLASDATRAKAPCRSTSANETAGAQRNVTISRLPSQGRRWRQIRARTRTLVLAVHCTKAFRNLSSSLCLGGGTEQLSPRQTRQGARPEGPVGSGSHCLP